MKIITIDGPAASGKSTVARALAQHLQWYYLNSGMLYRALGYCLLHNAGLPLDALKSCDITLRKQCLEAIHYSYTVDTGVMVVTIDNTDVTQFLKDPIIDRAASFVGENKQARDFLLNMQRIIANHNNLVAEGRDAGSEVFPNATIKFFLTANEQVRALRWLEDQRKHGNNLTFEDALKMIEERDARDANRPHAPLRVAPDGIIIDNSQLSLQQTLTKLLTLITKKIGKR